MDEATNALDAETELEIMKATFRAIKVALGAVSRALKHDDWAALTGQPIQSVVPLRS